LPSRSAWAVGGALALVMAAIIPYFAMSKGAAAKDKKAAGSSAIPVSAALWTIAVLIYGAVVNKGSFATSVQGMIVSIMYVYLSSFMGYNMNAAKKDPAARASALFSMVVYFMLLIFDSVGLKNSLSAAASK